MRLTKEKEADFPQYWWKTAKCLLRKGRLALFQYAGKFVLADATIDNFPVMLDKAGKEAYSPIDTHEFRPEAYYFYVLGDATMHFAKTEMHRNRKVELALPY